MAAHNLMRELRITGYAVDREYRVENKGARKQASLKCTMISVAPDEKLFEVTSYTGSGFMRKAVLNRLIDTERQNASGPLRAKTAISPVNYLFQLLRKEIVRDRPQYVLSAKPKEKSPLLFEGLVWIDAEDFAVTQIEGRPSKNPSFWTRKVQFKHEYAKFDSFWFPVRNSAVTSIFIFGRTTTEITYGNYRINQAELRNRAGELRKRGDRLEIEIPARDRKAGNP